MFEARALRSRFADFDEVDQNPLAIQEFRSTERWDVIQVPELLVVLLSVWTAKTYG